MKPLLPIILLCAAAAITAQDYYGFTYDPAGNTTSISPRRDISIADTMLLRPDSLIIKRSIAGKVSVTVTPNPTTGLIEVFVGGMEESSMLELRIYSPSGQKIYETLNPEPRFTIDLTGQQNGIYIIETTNADTSETFKFIKK